MSRVTTSRVRFTAREFRRMVKADVFGTERVELLDGRVYFMTQLQPHIRAITRATKVFNAIVGPADFVAYQGTLPLDKWSLPDPDVVWIPVPEATPQSDWPKPILVVEISHTTYKRDSGRKLRKYAFHGIPEYWIENLKADRVEVYRDPQNPTGREADCRYASVEHFGRGQTIGVLARPGVSVRVDDLLP